MRKRMPLGLLLLIALIPLAGCSNTYSAPGEPPSVQVALPDKEVKNVEKFLGKIPADIPAEIATYQAWRNFGHSLVKEKRYAEALYCYDEAFKIGPVFNAGSDLMTNGGSQRSRAHLIAVSSPGSSLKDKGLALVAWGKYEPALFYFDKWRENDFMAEADDFLVPEVCAHFELKQYQQAVNKTGRGGLGGIVKGAAQMELGQRDEGKALIIKCWNDYSSGSSNAKKRIKKHLTPGVIAKLGQAGVSGL